MFEREFEQMFEMIEDLQDTITVCDEWLAAHSDGLDNLDVTDDHYKKVISIRNRAAIDLKDLNDKRIEMMKIVSASTVALSEKKRRRLDPEVKASMIQVAGTIGIAAACQVISENGVLPVVGSLKDVCKTGIQKLRT